MEEWLEKSREVFIAERLNYCILEEHDMDIRARYSIYLPQRDGRLS